MEATNLGSASIGITLASHKSANFLPAELPTEVLPSRTDLVTTETKIEDVQNHEMLKSMPLRASRLGQDIDRADTAHGPLKTIEFINPFQCTKALISPNLAQERYSIVPPPPALPEWAKKENILSQPPKLNLDLRCTSLDSRCMSVSSQPPKLQLNLMCSSTNSSKTSLLEEPDWAVAERSQLQRLRPAVVHVKTPSPRTSGEFGAHYGRDPRLSRMVDEENKRKSSV